MLLDESSATVWINSAQKTDVKLKPSLIYSVDHLQVDNYQTRAFPGYCH